MCSTQAPGAELLLILEMSFITRAAHLARVPESALPGNAATALSDLGGEAELRGLGVGSAREVLVELGAGIAIAEEDPAGLHQSG